MLNIIYIYVIGVVRLEKKVALYQGKRYILLHQYSSDYCEIKEEGSKFNILLVHISELTLM
jgi:hypothetical protein